MPLTEHYFTRFTEGNFFHVYNRSVDRKPLFKNEGNYSFFLNKFDKYLSPVLDIYAYSLLVNHFHFLVSVKKNLLEVDLTTFKKLSNANEHYQDITVHDIVSHQFRKFFQSYAMAFNKQQNRIGTLFQTPFKRALIDQQQYLNQLVYYIHTNPQYHKLTNDFRSWNWSSYNKILNDKQSKLKKKEVLQWFGNKEMYLLYHSGMKNVNIDKRYIIEED